MNRTDRQIVNETNKLGRDLLALTGYVYPPAEADEPLWLDRDKPGNSRRRLAWRGRRGRARPTRGGDHRVPGRGGGSPRAGGRALPDLAGRRTPRSRPWSHRTHWRRRSLIASRCQAGTGRKCGRGRAGNRDLAADPHRLGRTQRLDAVAPLPRSCHGCRASAARGPRRPQARSNRSRFMTLVQAATKSRTNCSPASRLP